MLKQRVAQHVRNGQGAWVTAMPALLYCTVLHCTLLQQNSSNPTYNNLENLIIWHLRRRVSRLEILLSVTSGTHTDSMNISVYLDVKLIQQTFSPSRILQDFINTVPHPGGMASN
jgi:hypothetical protein